MPMHSTDGWDFYHYLDSPEQGLLVVPLFSDILPRSGGTTIATDSVQVLARFLVQHREGVHPDGTQGGGCEYALRGRLLAGQSCCCLLRLWCL